MKPQIMDSEDFINYGLRKTPPPITYSILRMIKAHPKLVIEIINRLKDSELRKQQEQCLNGCDF